MRYLAMVVGSVGGAAKDNKDNQVPTVSYHRPTLSIMKTYSGEKSNKCNQCEYASFQASNLKTSQSEDEFESTGPSFFGLFLFTNPTSYWKTKVKFLWWIYQSKVMVYKVEKQM